MSDFFQKQGLMLSETSNLQPVNLSETSRDTGTAGVHQRAADSLQSF